MKNTLGMKVVITWRDDCPFVTGNAPDGVVLFGAGIGTTDDTILRNVTEVHFGYRSFKAKHDIGPRIAFESSVHSTGANYDSGWIKEYVVTPETERADSF